MKRHEMFPSRLVTGVNRTELLQPFGTIAMFAYLVLVVVETRLFYKSRDSKLSFIMHITINEMAKGQIRTVKDVTLQ